jgi:hypothetical protein
MAATVKQFDLAQEFEEVICEYNDKEPKTKGEIEETLKKYPSPKKLVFPKSPDVKTVDKLFSDKKSDNVRNSLLLMDHKS